MTCPLHLFSDASTNE